MSPFEALGDRPRWRVIYEDVLPPHGVGDLVEYAELGAALGLHPDDDRHVVQMSMRRAAKEYLEVDKRALEAVPNQGYRIVEAPEHLRLARGQQKRAGKALQRGQAQVVHVDLNGVEPDTRKAFEVVAQAFAMQLDFNRRFDTRQRRLEQVVQSVGERSDRTEAELAELRARLARLEGKTE